MQTGNRATYQNPSSKNRRKQRNNRTTPDQFKYNTPYYNVTMDLRQLINLKELRNTSSHRRASIVSPFFNDSPVTDDPIKHHEQYHNGYISNDSDARQNVQELHERGIHVYIIPNLHTKTVRNRDSDTNRPEHEKASMGLANTTIHQDLNGHDRFVTGFLQ